MLYMEKNMHDIDEEYVPGVRKKHNPAKWISLGAAAAQSSSQAMGRYRRFKGASLPFLRFMGALIAALRRAMLSKSTIFCYNGTV